MKHFVFFVPMFLISLVLMAQEHNWQLGTSGLLGKSKFTYSDAPSEYTNKLAFQAGLYSQYAFPNRHFAFRLGVGYSHTKGGYTGTSPAFEYAGLPSIPGDPFEVKFEYAHVVLPMEILIDLGKDPTRGFYVLFGPMLQFQIQRKAERTVYLNSEAVTSEISRSADRKLDLFGELGLGYAFPLGSGYHAFIQPILRTNIPGNVLDFIDQEKGRESDHITVYVYGLAFGVSRGF